MKKLIFILSLIAIISIACEPQDKTIPSYIHIDSFNLVGEVDSVGSLSHKIIDVWVLADGDFIGTFQLPATIPILKNGKTNLTIRPGIKDNGISSTHNYYAFYKPYTQTVELKPQKIDTIKPVISYSKKTKFNLIEDYESSKRKFKKTVAPNVNIDYVRISNKDTVFEGNFCSAIYMEKLNDLFEIQTIDKFKFKRGNNVYIEINYRNEIEMRVGYYVYEKTKTEQVSKIVLRPKQNWNKIYINLTQDIDRYSRDAEFTFFIGAYKPDSTEGICKIYLDNIKILSFE